VKKKREESKIMVTRVSVINIRLPKKKLKDYFMKNLYSRFCAQLQ
jgi:hypothetical protein